MKKKAHLSSKLKYYQPDLSEKEWEKGRLSSFEVYASKEVCQKDFPKKHIDEYSGSQIEEPSFVDGQIEYDGLNYPLRLMILNANGIRQKINLAPECLQRKLHFGKFMEYVNKEAQQVDEQIYFYVPDEDFSLSDKDLFKKHIHDTYNNSPKVKLLTK